MRRTRRRKHSWLGRLIVKCFVVVSVLAGALFGISACARKDIGALSGNQPRLVLEEFFAGKSVAYGIFEDRFGNLRRQFRVNLNGNLDGNRPVAIKIAIQIHPKLPTQIAKAILKNAIGNRFSSEKFL